MVSLCVREWIETSDEYKNLVQNGVSLCVREWIETLHILIRHFLGKVSLCVREWIETSPREPADYHHRSLPLREGVD